VVESAVSGTIAVLCAAGVASSLGELPRPPEPPGKLGLGGPGARPRTVTVVGSQRPLRAGAPALRWDGRWGRCTRGAATRARRGGARGHARAAALGADGAPESARSGRPPSRRRSRPRAEGTSGSGAGHRARAVQALMFAMTGTCVRKLGKLSDLPCANMRTHRARRAKTALPRRSWRPRVQRPLHRGRSGELGGSVRASCAGRSAGG
jgi:hypothetical protein